METIGDEGGKESPTMKEEREVEVEREREENQRYVR